MTTQRTLNVKDDESIEDHAVESLLPGYLRSRHVREALEIDREELARLLTNGDIPFVRVAGTMAFSPIDVGRRATKRAAGY